MALASVFCALRTSISPELIVEGNLMFEFLYLTPLEIEELCKKAENYRGFPNKLFNF